MISSTELEGDFESLWRVIFESHVGGEESFSYVLSRTLMRPREVLRFCRSCLDVAISRGKDKVMESDILQAERLCSSDALVDIRFELKDVATRFEGVPDAFHFGAREKLPGYCSRKVTHQNDHLAQGKCAGWRPRRSRRADSVWETKTLRACGADDIASFISCPRARPVLRVDHSIGAQVGNFS